MTTQSSNVESAVNSSLGCLERARSGCLLVGINLLFIFFIVLFLYFANRDYQLQQEGVSAVGMVIGLEESSSGEDGCCVYSPVVEFTADGQTYTFESSNASDPPRYKVGEQVTVVYLPENPQRAEVEGGSFWWLWAGLAVLFVVLLLIISAWGGMRIWRGEAIGDD
jgi:4-amino-4-deoxy-L-arabinose transferase-like glycosyltransferase